MLTPNDVAASLDAPGKGLPKTELWIARIIVGWRARRASREESVSLFARERQEIVRLARIESDEEGSRRVLIKRLRGMEDSSRFWSVFMTLDHLRIVNEGTAGLIGQLARGETPARVVGTADVKPSPSADISVIEQFEHSCEHFEKTVAAIADLRTNLRWPHPWFGPLDAAKWHFFTAFHMGLHRTQIEAIRATRKGAS